MLVILSFFSRLINRGLSEDPEIAAQLSKYENKIIKIELLPFHYLCYANINNQKISLSHSTQQIPDVSITGTPLNLLQAMRQKDKMFHPDISIQGDVSLLQELKRIFDAIEIDWTDIASRFIGTPLAYTGSQIIARLTRFQKNIANTTQRQLKDYLEEEQRLLVSRREAVEFYASVDEVRNHVDRLSAKIELLLS